MDFVLKEKLFSDQIKEDNSNQHAVSFLSTLNHLRKSVSLKISVRIKTNICMKKKRKESFFSSYQFHRIFQ
jgi:hypothetical protein